MPGCRVAVIVLNYHSTPETVAAVLAVTAGTRPDLRVVVVDNDAPGSGHEALREALSDAGLRVSGDAAASVRLVATGGNLGYAAGNNIGLRVAAAWFPEFYWLLNPDIRVRPDTLAGLLDVFDTVPDAGAVGARVVLDDPESPVIWSDGGTVAAGTGQAANLHMGRSETSTPPRGVVEVAYVYGGCLLVRSAVPMTVGPVPEEYFLYFEETDWCRRMAAYGWRVLVDQRVRVVTTARRSGGMIAAHYLYYMTRNRILFCRRLGVDQAAALSVFRASFLRPWRERVAAADPLWLGTFDALVDRAARDADADRFGRNTEVESVAGPVVPARAPDVPPNPVAVTAGSAA